MPTATSMMEKGEPDIAPELWINSVRIALDAATAEGRLHYAAEVLSDTGEEGWWIPQYLADANPDIVTVEDALARPELFPHPEGDGAALYTCPSGWNCQISTGNLFQAYDAESKGFNLVDPGSGGALDAAISGAFTKGKPIFSYYWTPTSLMGKAEIDMIRLEEPAYTAECWGAMSVVVEDIKANGQEAYVPSCACEYKDMALTKTIRADWAAENPDIAAMIKAYALPTEKVNEMLAYYVDESGGDMEATAIHFLSNETVWESWVSADVAANIKKAL